MDEQRLLIDQVGEVIPAVLEKRVSTQEPPRDKRPSGKRLFLLRVGRLSAFVRMKEFVINLFFERSGRAERYVNFASALLVLAVFSLIWNAGSIFTIPVSRIAGLIVIGIGCILGIGAFYAALPRFHKFLIALKRYQFLAIFIVAPLLGLLGSWLEGFMPERYFHELTIEYIRILFGLVLFVLTTYVVFARPRILKPVFIAMMTSSFLLWSALVPAWEAVLLDAGRRLRGAGDNVNQLAAWIAVSLIVSLAFFLWERNKIRWGWFALSLTIAPLLFWTASRAAWLTTTITLINMSVLFLMEQFSRERVRLLGIMFLGLAASLALGFSLFSPLSRAVIATRAVSPFVKDEYLLRIVQVVASGEKVVSVDTPAKGNRLGPVGNLLSVVKTSRWQLWQEGMKRFLRSPLGLGPGYYLWNPIGVEGEDSHKLDAHNLWLGVGLTTGWLGFGVWVLFMIFIGREAVRMAFSREPQLIALAASFFMLLLLGSFIDMLALPLLWLITGLIVANSVPDNHGD